jgi:putative membrane protein
MEKKRENYQLFLLGIFLIVWIWAAINPITREGWLNENYVVFIGVPFLIFLIRYFKLSNLSVTFITIFMVLHVIASHYTYLKVPFGFYIQNILGVERNMYDRFMHLLFGALMIFPIREAFMKLSKSKGFWTYYLPFDMILACSAFFEILELCVVLFIRPEATASFMGFQNDFWDATKDMLNAFIGALVTISIIFIINISRHRQARKELKKSFAIKNKNL